MDISEVIVIILFVIVPICVLVSVPLYLSFASNVSVVGRCRICNTPIFKADSPWDEKKLCINCWTAYKEGKG